MDDLHKAICGRLDERPITVAGAWPPAATRVNDWATKAHDALLAVLELHDPRFRMQALDTGEWLAVDGCREAPFSVAGLPVCTFADGERAEERYVPCPTVLAIAAKLGVETSA